MNITFLIGNGFDLNLGLKTSYTDFLNHYLNIKNKDKDIIDFKNKISKDRKLWSDSELAFGELTNEFSLISIDVFEKCYNDFGIELSKYLEIEQNKIQIPKESRQIIYTINNIFNSFYSFKYLPQQSTSTIKEMIQKNYGYDHFHFNFINFNYTNTFDKFINFMKASNQPLIHKNVNNNSVTDLVYTPIHIHGKINDGMVFGVDNKEQILNILYSSNNIFNNYFIKSNAIDEIGTLSNITSKKLIDDSQIICIFGMSFGETDRTWWDYIKNWLTKGKINQLILYIHEPEMNNCLISSIAQRKSSIFEKLFNSVWLESDNELKNRVHFSFNKNLFGNLKSLVTISEEDKEISKITL